MLCKHELLHDSTVYFSNCRQRYNFYLIANVCLVVKSCTSATLLSIIATFDKELTQYLLRRVDNYINELVFQ